MKNAPKQTREELVNEIYAAIMPDERVQSAWMDARDVLDDDMEDEEYDKTEKRILGNIRKAMKLVAAEKGYKLTPSLIELGDFEDFWNDVYM